MGAFFTITDVDPRPGTMWSNIHGSFDPWKVQVAERPGEWFEWSRKRTDPSRIASAPDVGLSIEADVQQSGYGPKLKNVKVVRDGQAAPAQQQVQPQAESFGQQAYQAGQQSAPPQVNQTFEAPRTDATGRSIERQVAAKVVAEMLAPRNFANANDLGNQFRLLFAVVDGCIAGRTDGQG